MGLAKQEALDIFNKHAGDTVWCPDVIDGERVFEFVCYEPYTRLDEEETFIAVWKTTCRVCGDMFTVTTPGNVETTRDSSDFNIRTCEPHRGSVVITNKRIYARTPAARNWLRKKLGLRSGQKLRSA